MPAPATPKPNAGPGQHALAYAAIGWRVLPIKPGEKRPPMSAWQKHATTDTKVIINWFKNLYREHGVGVATGEESGTWVLDVDVGPDKAGAESLAALEAEHGPLPATVEAVTGSGGRHLYFCWPKGRRVITRRDTGHTASPLPAGIDVRGEGGQVLAPPTVHPSGTSYVWAEDRSPWEIDVAEAPEWLLEIVCEREQETPTVTLLDRPASGDDDSIAEWHNARTDWVGMLAADGWTPLTPHGNQQYWVRPDKPKNEGHSATLHLPDGPFVIFSTDGSLSRYAQPWARTASGDGWAFSKFGYLAARHHGGDRSEAARRLREVRTEYEHHAAVVANVETSVVRQQWRTGAEFILDQRTELVAIWGEGEDVLWQRGEAMHLVAPTGVGKTTIAVQLVKARLGLQDSVLGFPVLDDGDRILYLAMDRPSQIARAMARVFTLQHRAVLHDRLVVWRGPLPTDLGKRPETLLEMCRRFEATTVIIDSLKDAAVKLTDDEVGGNLNRAIQYCTVEDIEVCGLHHQRKRTSNGEKPKTLDDVYGSTWITAGAGSVVLLWGAAGDPLVELVHLKQPANEVGPLHLEHDHYEGTTSIYRGFDALMFLRNRGRHGATTAEAARAMHEREKVTDNERKKAQRLLDGLVRKGLAERQEGVTGGARDGERGSEGARYFPVDNSADFTAASRPAQDITPGQVTDAPISAPITAASRPSRPNQDITPGQVTDGITAVTAAPITAVQPPPFRGGAGVVQSAPEGDELEW